MQAKKFRNVFIPLIAAFLLSGAALPSYGDYPSGERQGNGYVYAGRLHGYETYDWQSYRRHSSRYNPRSNYRNQSSTAWKSKQPGRETKEETTWEAPTREDERINAEIEQKQIDYGPDDQRVLKLMWSHAQRYFEAHDYRKAITMTDRILALAHKENGMSRLPGIEYQDVIKLQATARGKLRPPSSNHFRRFSSAGSTVEYGPNGAILNTRPQTFRPISPFGPSPSNVEQYSGSRRPPGHRLLPDKGKVGTVFTPSIQKKQSNLADLDSAFELQGGSR